ncbi:putative MSF multidrug transporter [Cucurbitaria berberidis CBS 394.84]|uniref:MSF multidrug transporter n=1 Tax=Cucurbitaria berberidis CBS 394.84 TaxID=1168544 RepID=A0A9P4GHU0_9PLEO|nr:putative MSF multidrug transporter [Cucurbitaria berberidis CBS 394.84]KAF1845850.1 putative MSF multidrug transporter [Cucurbitaria berberidis CBS 394.84]
MAEDKKTNAIGEAATMASSATPDISPTRLYIIIAGLWFCLFISALDTTIVTTALIKISSGFNALEQAPWLVTAYLLTYNSFLMITAKLSDIWGLKILMISCAVMFLIFSMACGGAQTMVQLIVFRAFQGIGGSGLYSLTFVAIMKLISPEKIGFYSGVISSVFAVANLLGPLLGGTISDRTTWRWIFFINGPIVSVAIALLFFSMPSLKDGKTNSERVRSLDGTGGLLSVCWPIPLIFALQEAGGSHPWSSGTIIGPLVGGIVLLLAFVMYETWVTHRTKKDPIFPIHFLRNPSMALILLSMFLLGMPFYSIFVQLPQRFQVVNFTSAERAGILLLPATVVSPVGAMVAGLAAKRIPAEFILICSTVIVCVGIGLMSSLPTYSQVWPGVYGFEIITGLGLGLASPPYFMLVATSIPEKDISVGTGALNMVRTLGGAVAVAICTAIHRGYLNDHLPNFLTPEQVLAVQGSRTSIAHLPDDVRNRIGRTFGGSYNRQFHIMLAFTGLNIIVAILLALARKRMGLFGVIPERKEGNEFMKAAEKQSSEEAKGRNKEGPADFAAVQSTQVEHNSDDILTVGPGESKKLG